MKIRVSWMGIVEVEADSFQEAIEKVVIDANQMDNITTIGASMQGSSYMPMERVGELRLMVAKKILDGVN